MDMQADHPLGTPDPHAGGRGEVPVSLKDPVCGMTVTVDSPNTLEHEGKPYYFCSARCKAKFAADPQTYLHKQTLAVNPEVPTPAAAAGAIYTCPMHPEIRQDHAGSCPKCGMALELAMPSLDEDENP